MSFIIQNDCHFIFTRVEKVQVAKMKFVDTLMDSGVNLAVSPLCYGNRAFRLPVALAIGNLLSPVATKAFWDTYACQDFIRFKQILSRVRWNAMNKLPDPRMQEIIITACDWAMDYPESVLDFGRGKLDSPNCVAFSLLVNSIHKQYEGTLVKVNKFYHDEQNEFAKSLHKIFELLRSTALPTDAFSNITDISDLDTYQCALEIVPSKMIGLQIVDVVLWLTKRYIEVGWNGLPQCTTLVKFIIDNSIISTFTANGLAEEVSNICYAVSKLPLTNADIARGMEFKKQIEAAQKERMEQYVKK